MAKLQLKRGSQATLTGTVFDIGEPIYCKDTKDYRIGDGVTAWENLKPHVKEAPSDNKQYVRKNADWEEVSIPSGALTDAAGSIANDGKYYARKDGGWAEFTSLDTLPTASADTLGGVKIGSGITITDGVISVTGGSGGGSELTFASGETEVTLPGTPSNGQIYEYVGTGDVWTITANAGQTIRLLGYTGNTLTAEHPYACAGLVFLDNVWIVRTQVGTLDLSTV